MTFQELAIIANDIQKHLDIGGQGVVPVSSSFPAVKTYHAYIKDAVTYKSISHVDILSMEYVKKHILGRFHRYNDYAEVWISKELNGCWTRYIAAKELSHLIIDNSTESMSTDMDKTILWIIEDGMKQGIDSALDSENTAAHLAAELLMPYETSQPLLRDASVSNIDIAKRFRVPLRVVEAMKFKSDYLDMRDEAYKIALDS